MRKYKVHSDLKSPFWMVRLILHGITTLLALVMVISSISIVVTSFFIKDIKFKLAPAIALAVPGAMAFCYHLPQWVCVIVGRAHRGIPPYPVVAADLFFFLAFLGVTIYYAISGQFSNAFVGDSPEVFFSRGCIISVIAGAVTHFFLTVIGAYDIFFIRRSSKEQVYVVTGYNANDDVADALDNVVYDSKPMMSEIQPYYPRVYHARDESVDANETQALNHQHHQRNTSIV